MRNQQVRISSSFLLLMLLVSGPIGQARASGEFVD